jgi:dynactin complex subunit
MTRYGTLRYLGKVKFDEGYWAGLELNDPTGTHNGEVDGEVYFQTKDKHGYPNL